MALKRKRSSQTFSSPFSDTSVASTDSSGVIPFFYHQSKPIAAEPLHQKLTWSFPTYDEDHLSAQHLNSRTRKRHRDDRPDEQTVYGVSCWLGAVVQMSTLADVCHCAASTINKLYEAQRRQPDPAPLLSQPSLSAPQVSEKPQKSTLHSFWRIPQQPPVSTVMAIDSGPILASNFGRKCEDCDSLLQGEDAMDLDGVEAQDKTCCSCRRHVCDTCAVLDNERICLACASARR